MGASDILTLIDTRITEILADTGNFTSYRIGDKSVNKTEALNALRELRKQYADEVNNAPTEIIQHIAYDFDEIGVDESEYIGDGL